MLETVDLKACYTSHACERPTTIVYVSNPKAQNKLTPRYLQGECLVLRVTQRGVTKFASRLPAAGCKDKSVFEFRWVTNEQGISLITNTIFVQIKSCTC